MTHALYRHFVFYLLLCSSAVVFSQVSLTVSPRFAEAGQPVTIQAYAEANPTGLVLNWTGDAGSGQTAMTFEAAARRWTGTIPADAVQGSELSYTVTADYADAQQAAGPDCTLFVCPVFSVLEPQTLELTQTVLVQEPWNQEPGFGLLQPQEGPPLGPASIAYHKGLLHVLDTINQRVVSYTRDGQVERILEVPSELASDLLIDPSDGAVLVVSQLDNTVYRFRQGRLESMQSVPMKDAYEFPAKFNYDSGSKRLYARHQNRRDKLAPADDRRTANRPQNRSGRQTAADDAKNKQIVTDVQGRQILLKTAASPAVFAVLFDEPVGYIDETVTDDNGIVWVLYTMRGDYRMRRLMRLDTVNATAETASINVWFAFDATRRMTATDTGTALLTGDESQGRIVLFDYAGGF